MTTTEVRLEDPSSVGWEWDELARRTSASPFVRRGWCEAWQEAYGQSRLALLTARREGALVGALPVRVGAGVVGSPTNWHTPEYTTVALDPTAEAALLEAAVARNGRRLEVAFVDDRLAAAVSTEAGRRGHRALRRVLERGPYLELPDTVDRLHAGLDRHMLREIARRRRRLEELGTVSLEIHEKADPSALQAFFDVESSGWKGESGTAIASEPATRRFYEDVAAWTAEEGWLRLALLRVGSRVVAGDLAVEHAGVHYLLKTGFDPTMGRYGPGKILRLDMMESALRHGARSYEFLGVDDAWKQEWTRTARPRWLVQVFAPTVSGRLDHAAYTYGRPVLKAALSGIRRWRR